MKKIYRGWFISKDPFDPEKFQAVKGKERITGTAEQTQRAIDSRALKEMEEENNMRGRKWQSNTPRMR